MKSENVLIPAVRAIIKEPEAVRLFNNSGKALNLALQRGDGLAALGCFGLAVLAACVWLPAAFNDNN